MRNANQILKRISDLNKWSNEFNRAILEDELDNTPSNTVALSILSDLQFFIGNEYGYRAAKEEFDENTH